MSNEKVQLEVVRPTAADMTDQFVDELLSLYAAVQEAVAGTDNDPLWEVGVHPRADQLHDAAAAGALFVAKADGHLAGALIADGSPAPGYENIPWQADAAPDEAAVMHLFALHPAFRGQGLARPFVQAVEQTLRKQGKRALRLDTLVDNYGAQRVYEALGFTNLGRASLAYGPGPYADNPEGGFVVFEKAL